jgi:hypothetical protein
VGESGSCVSMRCFLPAKELKVRLSIKDAPSDSETKIAALRKLPIHPTFYLICCLSTRFTMATEKKDKLERKSRVPRKLPSSRTDSVFSANQVR